MSRHSGGRAADPLFAQGDPAWAREFQAILQAYEEAGGKTDALKTPRVASAVISGHRVLSVNPVEGVEIETEEMRQGVRAWVTVEPGTIVTYPVHLCFGMLPSEGVQEIESHFEVGEGAEVGFIAHCTFPNALDLKHVMDAHVCVGRGATMRYSESHYHGLEGGIVVLPTTCARVDAGARFESEFSLVHGRVGRLDVNVEVDVASDGVVELVSKAYGSGDDRIRVTEVIRLNGERARGLAKTRAAVRDAAVSEVFTTAEGNAPGAVGHMDCTEIVRGRSAARNVPAVIVRDDSARVTHEAAIGSVDRKELETLMARGLSEDEAVDIVIRGMLR
jgi:Fe-S cluster assembly scaffold protein SufB